MFGYAARKKCGKRQVTRYEPTLQRLEDRVVLSTFKVNTTLDTVAVDLKKGKDATGHISLRSAIQASNARGGSNTIILGGGTITLTIAGANEGKAATGDLDISSNVIIKGRQAAATIIDADAVDRVFHVLGGKVTISGVTIQNGLALRLTGPAARGGGLLNSGGQVTLSSVVVANNRALGTNGLAGADGIGGGVRVGPAGGNGGGGSEAQGGGIFNAAGSLSIINSTIASNRALGGDGGNGGDGGFAQVLASTPNANGLSAVGGKGGDGGVGGPARGGGVFNAPGASLILNTTTFSNNQAVGGKGGDGGDGGFAQGGPAGATSGNAFRGGDGAGGNGGIGGASGA